MGRLRGGAQKLMAPVDARSPGSVRRRMEDGEPLDDAGFDLGDAAAAVGEIETRTRPNMPDPIVRHQEVEDIRIRMEAAESGKQVEVRLPPPHERIEHAQLGEPAMALDTELALHAAGM